MTATVEVPTTIKSNGREAPKTILELLTIGQRFETYGGAAITSEITVGEQTHIAMGYDIGNRATKVALLSNDGRLISVEIPTAYQLAAESQSGIGVVSYRLGDGDLFWIGVPALQSDGKALPVGTLPQRLSVPAMQEFTFACMAEALHRAGYGPGEYRLAVGFAIPNTEMRKEQTEHHGERLGVAPETRDALVEHIKGPKGKPKMVEVARVNEQGREERYSLTIGQLLPQAQSVGTFTAYTRTPTGALATDIEVMELADIGGGDFFLTTFYTNPYRMEAKRLGDGTIVLARALRDLYPFLTDIAAQEALRTGTIREAGRRTSIADAVAKVKRTQGEELVSLAVPILRQRTRFGLFTGGGTLLLAEQLIARAEREKAQRKRNYDLVDQTSLDHDQPLATITNAAGSIFSIIFALSGKK